VGGSDRIRRILDLCESWSICVQFHGQRNRGVAEIVFAAEQWAFEEEVADCLILIEDDIVISRFFFSMMKTLARFALNNDQIGAFSAFGNASISYKHQFLTRNQYIPLHHRWGVGMTRSFWQRGRADYGRYLALMNGTPYRHRPVDRIRNFLREFKNAQNVADVTSQDGVHTAIMLHHGGFSFMPPTSYAINIGKHGLHCTPWLYYQHLTEMRGLYPFFPVPVPLSETRLRVQSAELFTKSVNLQYW